MDSTLKLKLGCYCWLIEGQIAYRWAATRERAKDQLFDDGIVEYGITLASECDFIGFFGTVDSAIRAAEEFLYGPQVAAR